MERIKIKLSVGGYLEIWKDDFRPRNAPPTKAIKSMYVTEDGRKSAGRVIPLEDISAYIKAIESLIKE
jgi:hypothetical protein